MLPQTLILTTGRVTYSQNFCIIHDLKWSLLWISQYLFVNTLYIKLCRNNWTNIRALSMNHWKIFSCLRQSELKDNVDTINDRDSKVPFNCIRIPTSHKTDFIFRNVTLKGMWCCSNPKTMRFILFWIQPNKRQGIFQCPYIKCLRNRSAPKKENKGPCVDPLTLRYFAIDFTGHIVLHFWADICKQIGLPVSLCLKCWNVNDIYSCFAYFCKLLNWINFFLDLVEFAVISPTRKKAKKLSVNMAARRRLLNFPQTVTFNDLTNWNKIFGVIGNRISGVLDKCWAP